MILVTGASGALGGLILDRLTAVPGADVVAGSRSPDAGARRIDFDEPSTQIARNWLPTALVSRCSGSTASPRAVPSSVARLARYTRKLKRRQPQAPPFGNGTRLLRSPRSRKWGAVAESSLAGTWLG